MEELREQFSNQNSEASKRFSVQEQTVSHILNMVSAMSGGGEMRSPRTDNSYNLYDLSFEAPEPRQEKGLFDDFKNAWKSNT